MNKLKDNIQIKEDEEMEIDLLDLFQFFKSRFLILLVVLLLGAVLAGGITKFLITPKYTATSKLYMVSASNDSVIDLTDLNLGTSLSEDYAELIKIRPILEEVIKDYDLSYTYEDLVKMLTIAPVGDTRILSISVESTSAEEAQKIANKLADKAVTYLPKLMDTAAPNIAEKAIVPPEPSSPNLIINTLLGAFGFLAVALIVLTILYLRDDTMRTAEDVEKAFGIMPLTVIPEGDIASISDKKEEQIKKQKNKERKKRKK